MSHGTPAVITDVCLLPDTYRRTEERSDIVRLYTSQVVDVILSSDMLSGISYNVERVTTLLSSVKPSYHLGQNESLYVVVQAPDLDHPMFPFPVNHRRVLWRLRCWITPILLLSLVFPVVICDNRSCSSEPWCVSAGADDPCTLYSSPTGPVGQFCSCVPYQHYFSLCLANVSLSVILNF